MAIIGDFGGDTPSAAGIGYDRMTSKAVSMLMKEWVRRAILRIHRHRFTYEVTAKVADYAPDREDLKTTADTAAQKLYVEAINECFPGCGVVAEEDGVRVPCTLDGVDIWFTCDGVDGTRAFDRRQSHGVGTMISMVKDGAIVAAYVGDVLSQEIYGFRPGSSKVHRITQFEEHHELGPLIDRDRPLAQQYVLLREMVHEHSALARTLLPGHGGRSMFSGYEITGGSIGSSMARLWKGEVGGALLVPGPQTPWDTFPVYGISRALGFRFLELKTKREWVPRIVPEVQQSEHELLVIHESRLDEFTSLFA
jgi:fructose-1,6-bisphosphatase/inositol monophosphatase family enzyme